jgi:hypothetical protein
MSDPAQPTWLGMSPATLLLIAGGVGAALTKGIGALWRVITGREANAILLAENKRLTDERDNLGKKVDALQEEKLRIVGIILSWRATGKADFGDLPTGVHNLAELMDPQSARKSLDTHPELENWDPALSTPPGLRLPRTGKKK